MCVRVVEGNEDHIYGQVYRVCVCVYVCVCVCVCVMVVEGNELEQRSHIIRASVS